MISLNMISKYAFISVLYFHKNLLMAKTGMDGMEVLERKNTPSEQKLQASQYVQ